MIMMIRFELQISGMGSDRSTNRATTTALILRFFFLSRTQKNFPRLPNKHYHSRCDQCDQMVRLFFNIWPFATVNISPIM